MDASEEYLLEIGFGFLTISGIRSHFAVAGTLWFFFYSGSIAAFRHVPASLHGSPVAFTCFACVKKGPELDTTFVKRHGVAEI